MSTFENHSDPLPQRIRDGLERLASVLRADQWSAAQVIGVTPTQMSVLIFLAGRGKNGIRVKDIAAHLGVSQPTTTDSISALERKDLIQKTPSSEDARAIGVCITSVGRKVIKTLGAVASATDAAVGKLSPSEQADLLLLLIKTIRQLQLDDAIPVQRMCISCRHFRPYFHSDAEHPHHCAFVNAAFGNRNLRIDCSDHETDDPAAQAATWTALNSGSETLQANRTS